MKTYHKCVLSSNKSGLDMECGTWYRKDSGPRIHWSKTWSNHRGAVGVNNGSTAGAAAVFEERNLEFKDQAIPCHVMWCACLCYIGQEDPLRGLRSGLAHAPSTRLHPSQMLPEVIYFKCFNKNAIWVFVNVLHRVGVQNLV